MMRNFKSYVQFSLRSRMGECIKIETRTVKKCIKISKIIPF